VQDLHLFLPKSCAPESRYWGDALADLAGAHIRARQRMGEHPDLQEYLRLAAGDRHCEALIREVFRDSVGPFKRELDVVIVSPLRPFIEEAPSIVYAARDREPDIDGDADVVVKVLNPRLVDDESAVGRFRQEIQLLKRARRYCDSVVCVYEAGRLTYAPDGIISVPAYVMERCKSTLQEERTNYRGQKAIRLVSEIASAVLRLHELRIVLRDLKPSNIQFRRTERGDTPVLADLGLAKDQGLLAGITLEHGQARGTPGYRSPQAMCGEAPASNAEERSEDVWSLGAVLYELLHPDQVNLAEHERRLGVEGGTRELVERNLGETSPDIRQLIARCLSPQPATRPTTEEVAASLRGCLDKTSRFPKTTSVKHPRWTTWGATFIIATLALVGCFYVGVAIWRDPAADGNFRRDVASSPSVNPSELPQTSLSDGVAVPNKDKHAQVSDLLKATDATAQSAPASVDSNSVDKPLIPPPSQDKKPWQYNPRFPSRWRAGWAPDFTGCLLLGEGRDVVSLSRDGVVAVTRDAFRSFETVTYLVGGPLWAACYAKPRNCIVVVGYRGSIFLSNDFGTSALSQLNIRVDGLQFAPRIFDFHLPIDASLCCVDIS